jgi:hypothetical protein
LASEELAAPAYAPRLGPFSFEIAKGDCDTKNGSLPERMEPNGLSCIWRWPYLKIMNKSPAQSS